MVENRLTPLGWLVMIVLSVLMVYLGYRSSVTLRDEIAGPQPDVSYFQRY